MVRHIRSLLAAFFILTLFASFGSAFVPAEHPLSELEIRPPDEGRFLPGRFIRGEERIDAGLDLFRERVGGTWAVQRDPILGTPHHLVGSGIEYVNERIDTEARADQIALSFLAEHADIFMADPDRLGEPSVTLALGKWAVVYPEMYRGLRVYGGRAHVVMTEEGRIYAAGSDFHPDLSISTSPSFPAAEATAIAGQDLSFLDGRDRVEESELLVYPERGEEKFTYRLAWRVVLETEDPLGRWESWVDAQSGELFARKNLYEFTDVVGRVIADVNDPGYCAGNSLLPVKETNVNVAGGNDALTDTTGEFVISHAGTDSVEFWARFWGPYFDVDNYDAPSDARDTITVLPGEHFDFHFDDTNSHQAERDGWYHANRVRDFIKTLDPSFTGLDYRMRVRVNRTDFSCPGNAWWDGQFMNFCKEGGGNANTASLGDVVYHEYGHGVTQHLYGSSNYSFAVSEGNSDILPLFIIGDPTLGRGFYTNQCLSGIRSANNSLVYPDDMSGQGHYDGQMISGFFWEARANLITTYGTEAADSIVATLWHFSRKAGKPEYMPDQVTWVFLYDDNDGNLDTGTPNWTELSRAADLRGFPAPVISQGVQITHDGLPSTTDDASPRTVTALVEGLTGGIDPSSVKMFYRTDGGSYSEEAMVPTGTPDEYEATLPAAALNSRVEYYLEAGDSMFHMNWSPANAPANHHRYDIVFLYDPCESLAGWTLGDPSDDATAGLWINGEPVGSETRPEYDATPGDGQNCFVTGNAGNVRNGKTTLYSPVYDLAGETGVVVRYRRWYSNDFEAVAPLKGRDEYWNADISNDAGANWVVIENTNIGTESWVEIEAEIDSIFSSPDQIQFRFVARDTGDATRIHAGVDEIRFLVYGGVSTEVAASNAAAVPRVLKLDQNRPNPFNPVTAISFEVPRRSEVSLTLFNVQGRRVRTLVDGEREAGAYRVAWDGTDESGRPVASGVYFYRLESDGRVEHRKMTLLR